MRKLLEYMFYDPNNTWKSNSNAKCVLEDEVPEHIRKVVLGIEKVNFDEVPDILKRKVDKVSVDIDDVVSFQTCLQCD